MTAWRVPATAAVAEAEALAGDILPAVERVALAGRYIGGPRTAEFEYEWANFVGARACIATGSGSLALQLALLAARVPRGSRVLTSPLASVAVPEVLAAVHCPPEYVDIDGNTGLMSEAALIRAAKAWRGPGALVPFHSTGAVGPSAPLRTAAQYMRAPLVEACWAAHGAAATDELHPPAGALGIAGCFSFTPGSPLAAMGQAGALVTSDAAVEMRARTLNVEAGLPASMDEVQAAVLLVKLPHLRRWNLQRWAIANEYAAQLRAVDGLRHPPLDVLSSWARYEVRTEHRTAVAAGLRERGVEVRIRREIALLWLQPEPARDWPVAWRWATQSLDLPIHPFMTLHDVDIVVTALKETLMDLARE